ncbi:hypothetical protein [Rosistilla oblonga]|uniref:DUF7448 domain-containing protein n=1 Tax=Rosistilla oblonga TaxID=2527990 RepID=UPI003A970288
MLTHIDTDEKNNEIMLTTESGKVIKIFHDQDCCETVAIEDAEGEWHKLFGKVLVEASRDEKQSECDYGSKTETTLKFRVDGATVISRWIGESNGYYSESVDIEEVVSQSR